jgi:hypothetical protein
MRNLKLPEPLAGKWIWGPPDFGGASRHVLFRKDFTLSETPGIAELWIASPSDFQLFINGRFLTTGPVQHPGNALYASRYDITHLLQVGVNSIAVHAICHMDACAARKPGAEKLWLQLLCDNATTVVTDNSWLCLKPDCFLDSGLRASASDNSTDIIDFKKYPTRWTATSCENLLKPLMNTGDGGAQPFFWSPPKIVLPLDDGLPLEAETGLHPSWDATPSGLPIFTGTFQQKNEVLTISFADCIKDKTPNGLYAAETYIYATQNKPLTALCICDEPYRLFINNKLVKQQGVPAPAARNLSNAALSRTLLPDELAANDMTVQLKNGWNRVLLLQHCSHPYSGMTIIWAELPDNAFPLHRKPDFSSPHGWNLTGPLNAPFALVNPAFPLDSLPKTPFLCEDSRTNDIAAYYLSCEFKATSITAPRLPLVLHSGETLLLDYGKTIYGLPEIRLSGAEGDIVDAIAGNHRFNDEIIALEEGRRRNVSTAILRQGLEPVTWVFNSPAGFRYLMIVARKVDTNVTIRSVNVRAASRETPNDSHFSCSDSVLNSIWKLGQNTLEVTNQSIFMDSPCKEQAQCIPDAMIQSWAACYVQGAYDAATAALSAFAKGQIETGELNAIAPSGFFQAVPDYSLLWPVWLQRHIMHTGDIQFLKTLIPTLNALLSYYNENAVAMDGPLGNLAPLLGTCCFLDHDPSIDRDGIVTGLNGIYCRSLLAASWLAEQAGLLDTAATYKQRAANVAAQIRSLCWNPDKGLFADSFHHGRCSEKCSMQSNVLAIYGSIPRHDDIDGIWQKLFVQQDPFERFVTPEFDNPYFKFFILEDAFALGKSDWGFKLIRHYWEAMLEAGATSAWELFHPGDPLLAKRTISKCHGYGVSPNAFIISELVGVRPAEPGMRMIYFNPLPGDVTWAKATIPTPNGTISVNWSLRPDGVFDASLSATFPLEVIPLLNPAIAESALFKVSENVTVLAPE